jgi:hypothetical protein
MVGRSHGVHAEPINLLGFNAGGVVGGGAARIAERFDRPAAETVAVGKSSRMRRGPMPTSIPGGGPGLSASGI